jgi:Ca2+-binding EF-hand superfamily protein
MKSIFYFILIGISLCNFLKSNQNPVIEASFDFVGLFKDPSRQFTPCPKDKDEQEEKDFIDTGLKKKGDNVPNWTVPHKKKNKYELKNQGWESSGYFFDYIDAVLQKPIVNEFTKIWSEATKITPDDKYKDPYSMDNLINASGSSVKPATKEDMVRKLVRVIPGINTALWESYISPAKLSTIVKQWNWDYDNTKSDWAKYIVDKYDYDGDGRLNPSEFILAMIVNNKKSRNSIKKCTNCMMDTFENYLDPIFAFIDCDNDGTIIAENIWNSLKVLKRKDLKDPNFYNIYNCDIEGSKIRTTAINDFVLKAEASMKGKLNRAEWRYGILLGYWSRQTDKSTVFPDDAKNMKNMRWQDNGSIDINCEDIKKKVKNGI